MKKTLNLKIGTINWQRSLLTIVLISLVAFILLIGFLLVKPIEKSISTIIDGEISSTNIIFDTKTIEILNKRQKPADSTPAPAGKNPFASF